jgi:CRP/FNR family transcriptional regulator, cyclic AMP receptor protein
MMTQNSANMTTLELLENGTLHDEFAERRQRNLGANPERRLNIPEHRHNFQPGVRFSERIAGMLENSQMFKGFDWPQIETLSGYIRLYRAKPGAILFHEGDKGDFLCIVLEGKLEIQKEDNQHKNKIISTVLPGRSLGEMTIVDGEPRSATAVVVAPSVLAVLTQENFLTLMRERPALSAKLLLKIAQFLSQRLRLTSGILVDYLEQ